MIPSPFHGIFSALQSDTPVALAPDAPTAAPVEKKSHSTGQISADVYEQDSYIIIRAPIAGVKLADLDIEVDGRILTIRGRRMQPEETTDVHYLSQECFWGEFSRSITLPMMVDPKKIRATFSKDCILKILIPKEEKVKIIRINEGN